jgi:hypothetical protein
VLAFLAPLLNSVFGQAFSSLVDGYKAKLAAGNTADKIAADLAARELAVQQTEVQAQAQLRIAEVGHFWEPDKLFEYTLWVYFSYALVWCNMLGYSAYVELSGQLLQWSAMIMAFLFGKRGIENVARILKR